MTRGQDDEGFDAFFRGSYPRLVAFGTAMSGSPAIGQDVAQDALLRAHRNWSEVRHLDHPYGWVRRVAGNLLIDLHRHRGSERRAVERLGGRARAEVGHDDPAGRVAEIGRWGDLVGDLTPRQRLVATLRYVDDLSVAELADALGVSAGTVKSSLSKARRNVRRSISGTTADTTAEDEEARP